MSLEGKKKKKKLLHDPIPLAVRHSIIVSIRSRHEHHVSVEHFFQQDRIDLMKTKSKIYPCLNQIETLSISFTLFCTASKQDTGCKKQRKIAIPQTLQVQGKKIVYGMNIPQ